jgi:thioredoxin reductase
MTSVVIIGAGPYGLSLAAHLRDAGVDFRIFGKPMANWREKMPAGMCLKSEGFASNLYEPQGNFTLRRFCEEQGIPYQDVGLPVALSTFVAYGLHFQRKFVPDLDEAEVESVERLAGGGFLVEPSGGEPVRADRVVVATGISHFHYIPAELQGVGPEFLSHSSDCTRHASLAGRDVVVVGAGASALDSAALLHEAGAKVRLVSRRTAIAFNPPPAVDRSRTDRLRSPETKLGPGWKNVFCERMPLAFHFLPERTRGEIVRNHLGPAPGWFVRDRTEGRFPFLLGATPIGASAADGRVQLQFGMADGAVRSIGCDHIVAATGYRADVRRLPFLGAGLVREIRTIGNAPALSVFFESSARGLYFTGLAAANHFGPVMRFACGAEFSVPHLARHLVRESSGVAAPASARAGAGTFDGDAGPLPQALHGPAHGEEAGRPGRPG